MSNPSGVQPLSKPSVLIIPPRAQVCREMTPVTRKCICGCDTTSPTTMARHRRRWLESPKLKSSKFAVGMAKLSSRSLQAPPSARSAGLVGPSGTDRLTVIPDDNGTSPSGDRAPPEVNVLCNEDRLSNYSESSLSITSPVVSDDDDEGSVLDLDESETESNEDWEDGLKGDVNRGQNLQFRLRAAAAGAECLFSSNGILADRE